MHGEQTKCSTHRCWSRQLKICTNLLPRAHSLTWAGRSLITERWMSTRPLPQFSTADDIPMQLRNKRVLITGANGFIGSHLAQRLACEKGVRVRELVRNETRNMHH